MKRQNSPIEQTEERLWTPSFVLIALINLAVFMGFNMTNTGIPVFVDLLGASPLEVGLVTTFATAAALVTRPFTGYMADRFDRKGIMIAGLAVSTVAVALFLVFPIVSAILILRLAQGLGWGLSSTATSTVVADIIPKKRFAEGMGYFGMTTSLAAAVAPALSILLLENMGGTAMVAVSLLCMVAALAMTILGRFNRASSAAPLDAKAGAGPDHGAKAGSAAGSEGEADGNRTASENPSAQDSPAANGTSSKPDASAHGAAAERPRFTLASLFDRRALMPSALICLVNIAFAPIGTFIVLHSQEQGVEGIFLYFVVYAVVNILTRPVIGRMIDRHGFFWPGILAAAGVVATMLLIAWGQNLVVFCVAGAFAGLGFGTAMGAFQTMAVSSVPPAHRGVATSTYLFGLNGGMAIGSLLAGILAGPLGYSGMYLAMAVFPVVAGIVVAALGHDRLDRYRPQ